MKQHSEIKFLPNKIGCGFALIEIVITLILLTILAVAVVPKYASAASSRQQALLKDRLNQLRTQIYIYRAEHNSIPPGYPKGDISKLPSYEVFVAQLTQYTNAAGATSPAPTREFKFGPYLNGIPVNPINNNSTVRLILGQDAFPTKPMGDEGWVYQPSTATVVANVAGKDSAGVRFFDY